MTAAVRGHAEHFLGAEVSIFRIKDVFGDKIGPKLSIASWHLPGVMGILSKMKPSSSSGTTVPNTVATDNADTASPVTSKKTKKDCVKVPILPPLQFRATSAQVMQTSFAGSGQMLAGSKVSGWCLGERAAREALCAFEKTVEDDAVTEYRLQSLSYTSLRHMGSSLAFLAHHIAVNRLAE